MPFDKRSITSVKSFDRVSLRNPRKPFFSERSMSYSGADNDYIYISEYQTLLTFLCVSDKVFSQGPHPQTIPKYIFSLILLNFERTVFDCLNRMFKPITSRVSFEI